MKRILLAASLFAALLSYPAAGQQPRYFADSAAWRQRLDDAMIAFSYEWRFLWQHEQYLWHLRYQRDSIHLQRVHNPPVDALREPSGLIYVGGLGNAIRGANTLGCLWVTGTERDYGPHEWMAHLIRNPERPHMSLCPTWRPPNWRLIGEETETPDGSFARFPTEVTDSARALRAALLAKLDSAGARYPGDPWIVGQRVRLHVDQRETFLAKKAVAGCEAEEWWCKALQGYVEFADNEPTKAAATFDVARRLMRDSVRCAWDDLSLFFVQSARAEYAATPCGPRRDSLNAHIWWLADPLYIENGNERRTEHYARHVRVALHRALDADERHDWRDSYTGIVLTEMFIRYGVPTVSSTRIERPMRWRERNTRATYLGDRTLIFPTGFSEGTPRTSPCKGTPARCPGDWIWPGIRYVGPQFHTVPLWSTVLDPFRATDEGWDVAPGRDGQFFDSSWWPTEFYRRTAGPLVPMASQIAFFRRQNGPVLMAAMEFDTTAFLAKPLPQMISAAILSTGPDKPLAGTRDTVDGRAPRPIVATVAAGPAVLSLEMIPRQLIGPAGRTRLGVVAPRPLREMRSGELALSDIALATSAPNQGPPESMAALVPRMLRSSILRRPTSVALFWELYGLGTGDTVSVALRVARRPDDPGAFGRMGRALGITKAGDDSLTFVWTEPRPGEPTATQQGGISIRPRSLALNLSTLKSGQYTITVQVERRGGLPVATTRRIWIAE